ncbi:MAG TPA: outer membrane beta-barrel protein [Gemmatimonadaceae bacterium]
MRIRTFVALATLAFTPALAQAQVAHPIEFGVDAGFSVTTGDPSTTTIAIPVQSLRVGFYVTEQVALEPSIAFNYQKQGDLSGTTLAPELGLVYDFTVDRKAPQFFVRPFAGLARTSFDDGTGSESITAYHAGLGLGVKVPFASVERFAWRIEGAYDHLFPNTDKGIEADNGFGLKLGLSFFTK